MQNHKLTYSEFNLRCYEYYCSNNSSDNYGSFLIPPSEIVDWLGLQYDQPKIEFSEIKAQDWNHFLKTDPFTKIPRCFGIIALQCYGAFLRQNSSETTDRQLNRAIENLLGYTTQQLQTQFGNGYPNNQDNIWHYAKKHLAEKGIEILLPKPTAGPGRNVQYPKSQVFFNLEMFKSLHPILKIVEEQFITDLNEFRTLINNKLRENYTAIRSIKNLLENTENVVQNRSVFVKQFYNYWRSSDWKNAYYLFLKERNYTKKVNTDGHEVDFQIYCDYEENILEFYCDKDGIILEHNDTNISQVIESGPILFSNSTETPFDFNQVFNFSLENPYLIFCKTNSLFKDKLDSISTFEWFSIDNISYAYTPNGFIDPRIAALFTDHPQSQFFFNPITLNAPRLDFRKNIILKGCEIELIIDNNFVLPNQVKLYAMIGKRISDEISLPPFIANKVIIQNLSPSQYCIQLSKFNSIKFKVADVSYTNNFNPIKNSFHIKEFSFKEDFDGIYGINYPSTNQSVNLSYQAVASALLYKKKTPSDNLILKAINRANHGRN